MKTSRKKQHRFRSNKLIPLLTILAVGAIGTYITIISLSHADTASAHNEPFGMAGLHSPGSADQTQQLNDYTTLGVQWARFGINWDQIQPTANGAYNWGKFDTELQQVTAHNLKPLGVIHNIPDWAKAAGCTAGTECHPASAAQFATFAGAVAAHFAPLGGHNWEIMGEVNAPGVWGTAPNASDYTADLKAAYTAIKSADSSATVVSAGLAIANSPGSIKSAAFLAQMYAAGARGYFDAAGEHPYCDGPNVAATCVDSPSPSDGWYQVVGPNNLHDVMVSNGDGNKLVWITEFGTNLPSDAASDALQVHLLNAAYAKQKQLNWLGPIFWYEYQDGKPFADGRTKQNLFGLVKLDGSHKPAFAAYVALTHPAQTPPPSGGVTPPPTPPSPTSTTGSPKTTPASTTSSGPIITNSQNNPSETAITPTTLIEHPSRAVHSWAGRIITLIVVAFIGLLLWRLGLIARLKRRYSLKFRS